MNQDYKVGYVHTCVHLILQIDIVYVKSMYYSTAVTITYKNEDLATATFISVKDGININFICLKVKNYAF